LLWRTKSIARFTVSRSDFEIEAAALKGMPESSFAAAGAAGVAAECAEPAAGGRAGGVGTCRGAASGSVGPEASASTDASAKAVVFLRGFFRIKSFPDRIIQFVCLTASYLRIAKPVIMAIQRW
jgi:hypothetical protein